MASTTTKVLLIGCLVIVVGVIAVVGGLGLFARKKFKEFTQGPAENEKKIEQLSKDYPFTPPANGVITEQQLQKFLAARKQIYSVYQKYEAEFKKLEGKDADLSTLSSAFSMLKDVRAEHARALEAQKMSPQEYQYIVNEVYKTWAASGTKEAMKDQTFSDQAEKHLKESIENIDKQLKDPGTHETVKKALQKTRDELQQQLDSLPQNRVVNQMDESLNSVPEENLALFKKYEPEIKKYSMHGLEYIGL